MTAPSPPSVSPDFRPPWHSRIGAPGVVLTLFVVAVIWSAWRIEGPGRGMEYVGSFLRFAANFFPPDFSVLPQTLGAFVETVQIAVLSTFAAFVISVPMAVGGARTLSPRWLTISVRLMMNGIRTIPSLLWALIAVAAVGPNPVAGVIGLAFYSVGYLGKFFSDAFESMDIEVERGLRSMGASAIQAFQYGVWPHARPLLWSHTIWMLEYNIRSAAIIGIVGAGGLGVQLHIYQEFYAWEKFAAVLIFILVVVTVLDLTGERVRRALNPGS